MTRLVLPVFACIFGVAMASAPGISLGERAVGAWLAFYSGCVLVQEL